MSKRKRKNEKEHDMNDTVGNWLRWKFVEEPMDDLIFGILMVILLSLLIYSI